MTMTTTMTTTLALLIAAAVVLSTTAAVEAASPQCTTLPPTSICYNVIDPNVTLTLEMGNNTAAPCIATLEHDGNILGADTTVLGSTSTLSEGCRLALIKAKCAVVYKPCAMSNSSYQKTWNITTTMPCKDTCDEIHAQCTSTVEKTVVSKLYKNGSLCIPTACSSTPTATHNKPVFRATPTMTTPLGAPIYSTCQAYTGELCRGIAPASVWVPGGASIDFLESKAAAAVPLISLAPRGGQHGTACRDTVTKLVCDAIFMPCDTPLSGNGLTTPFPKLPCRDNCLASTKPVGQGGCSPEFYAAVLKGQAGFDCTAASTTFNRKTCSGGAASPITIDAFPETETLWTVIKSLGNLQVTTQCNRDNRTSQNNAVFAAASLGHVKCPAGTSKVPNDYKGETINVISGLVKTEVPGGGTSCALACPAPIVSAKDYEDSDVLMMTVAIISLILCLFMLITYVTFPEFRRKFYIISELLCLSMISAVIVFGRDIDGPAGLKGYAAMRCAETYRPVEQADGGYCVFQGIMITYFAMAAVCWWTVQNLDLYLLIHYKAGRWPPHRKLRKNVAYVSFGWGVPLILCIIAAAEEEFGNSHNSTPWCLIISDPMSWGAFYYPIAVFTVVGCVLMGMNLWAIQQSLQKTASASMSARRRKNRWKIHIRPMLFILTFLIVWSFIFAYRAMLHFDQSAFEDETKEYISCGFAGKSAEECEPLRTSHRSFDMGLWFGVQSVVAGTGIIVFVVYGTNPKLYLLWLATLFRLLGVENNRFEEWLSTTGQSQQSSRSGHGSRQASRRNLRAGKTSSDTNMPLAAMKRKQQEAQRNNTNKV